MPAVPVCVCACVCVCVCVCVTTKLWLQSSDSAKQLASCAETCYALWVGQRLTKIQPGHDPNSRITLLTGVELEASRGSLRKGAGAECMFKCMERSGSDVAVGRSCFGLGVWVYARAL